MAKAAESMPKAGRDGRGGEAGNDAAQQQPADGRRPGHQDIVEGGAEVGKQHDGAAPPTVRERADDRRQYKLHTREHGRKNAEQLRGLRRARGGRGVQHAFNEAREDGRDHAEGEHVERDGEEDEQYRIAPGAARPYDLAGGVAFRGAVELVRDFGLCAGKLVCFAVGSARHLGFECTRDGMLWRRFHLGHGGSMLLPYFRGKELLGRLAAYSVPNPTPAPLRNAARRVVSSWSR